MGKGGVSRRAEQLTLMWGSLFLEGKTAPHATVGERGAGRPGHQVTLRASLMLLQAAGEGQAGQAQGRQAAAELGASHLLLHPVTTRGLPHVGWQVGLSSGAEGRVPSGHGRGDMTWGSEHFLPLPLQRPGRAPEP